MDHLVKVKLLGVTRFSEVYLMKNSTSDELFIFKIVNLHNLNKKEIDYLENEIQILSNITKHPNIIELFQIFRDNDNIYLAMEYCNGGTIYENLYKYINKNGKPFPEKLVQVLMKKILKGVKHLHDNGIIHCDLKLTNILLKYKNNKDLKFGNIFEAEVKIIDFNLSYRSNINKPHSVVGTVPNMAPSIIFNNNNPHKYYNEKVDIWSLGTLCYEMLFGKPLFPNLTIEEISQKILADNLIIPKTISVQARTFLYNMLRKDGVNRPTATQLLNDIFIIGDYHKFTKYNNNDNKMIILQKTFSNSLSNRNFKKNIDIFKFKNNSPPLDSIQNNDYNIICKGCKNKISGYIFICETCRDFNYCQSCYSKNIFSHTHSFQIINNNISHSQNIDIKKDSINKIYVNAIFKRNNGPDVLIIIDNNQTIDKLIEYYFVKINRPDLIDNYNKKFEFIYNAKEINKVPEQKIKTISKGTNLIITVIEKRSLK